MYILQLNNNNTGEWFEFNDQGALLLHHRVTQLSECPAAMRDAELIVLLPGDRVTTTSAKLPKMRAAEKSKAVPYALEEQLASDPENIFIAIANHSADGATAVAITDIHFLRSQIDALHAEGCYPNVVLPDFLCLSLEPDAWTILFKHKTALVRMNEYQGFSTESRNLALLLQLQLEKNKQCLPKKIILWQEEGTAENPVMQTLGIPIEHRDASNHRYFDITHALSKPAINFLVGEFRSKKQSSVLEKQWKRCGIAGVTLIGFLFVSQFTQWIYFQYQSTVLESHILQSYQTLFPGSKTVLEPRFRTARLLKQFEAASQGSVFLKSLSIAGKTMLQFPDIQMQSMQFNHQQLTLTVIAKNVDELSRWANAMHAAGLTVQQRVTSTDKNAITAEITL